MKYVLIGGIAILAVFLVVLSFIPLGIEPLTEVYFEDHTNLPSNISLNNMYGYSFTIHNLEYQEMAYDYTIGVYDENDTLLYEMDSGRVNLADNETITIPEALSIKDHFGRIKINVNVQKDDLGIVPEFKKKLWWPDPNYPTKIDIHFWVEEK